VPPPVGGAWGEDSIDNSALDSDTGTTPDNPQNAEGTALAFVGFTCGGPGTVSALGDFTELHEESASDGGTGVFVSSTQFVHGEVSGGADATITGNTGPPPAWHVISFNIVPTALSWRFWSMDPVRNNTYSGLRSRPWPDAMTDVAGTGTYTGDRSAAWDSITMPNGVVYTPSRARFPAGVLLLDDGSIVK
jgi:hypothetical protein